MGPPGPGMLVNSPGQGIPEPRQEALMEYFRRSHRLVAWSGGRGQPLPSKVTWSDPLVLEVWQLKPKEVGCFVQGYTV